MSYGLAVSPRYKTVTLSGGATVIDLGSPDPFPVMEAADLQVYRTRAGTRTELTLNSDYAVTLLDQLPGARVTLAAAAVAGDIIEVIGARPIARPTDLIDGQKFSDETLNSEFDSTVIRDQELARDVLRSYKAPYATVGKLIYPIAAGHFHMVDSAGNFVDGGPADYITQAQGYAAEALAYRDAILALAAGIGLPMPVLEITASTTITNAAHKYRTLRVTAASVILTVSALASLADDFTCTIVNQHATAAVRIKPTSGQFTPFFLYPGQRCTFYKMPGYIGVDRPLRCRLGALVQMWANSATGNADFDGLDPLRPKLTLNQMKTEVLYSFDHGGFVPQMWGTGDFNEAMSFTADDMVGASTAKLSGYNSTKCIQRSNLNGYCNQIGNGFRLIVDYWKTDSDGTTGHTQWSGHQTGVFDFGTNAEFGACPSGTHIDIDTETKVNFFGNHIISGRAAHHTFQKGGSHIWYAPGTRTFQNTPDFNFFHRQYGAGNTISYNGTVTNSGAVSGSVTHDIDGLSEIQLNGNTLPGATPGTEVNGGQVVA